eukprot:COSAG06_NODE_50450_length_318_cov_1.178082_1_plen_22_part_01
MAFDLYVRFHVQIAPKNGFFRT